MYKKMMTYTNSPILNAGLICGFLACLFSIVREIIFFELSINAILFSLIFFPIYLCLGALFSAILLLPLRSLAARTSLGFSLVIFLLTGFLVAGYLGYESARISNHLQNPLVGPRACLKIYNLITIALLGAGSALSAWLTIQVNLREHKGRM